MTSERKKAANRANAQRSTGPRTAEGKRRAAQNALKHGLAVMPDSDRILWWYRTILCDPHAVPPRPAPVSREHAALSLAVAEATRERADAALSEAMARLVSSEDALAGLVGAYLAAVKDGAVTGWTGDDDSGPIFSDVGPPEDVFLTESIRRAARDTALREIRAIERYVRRAANVCRKTREAYLAAMRRAEREAAPEPPPRRYEFRPGGGTRAR